MAQRLQPVESIYVNYGSLGAAHALDYASVPSTVDDKNLDDPTTYFANVKSYSVGDIFGFEKDIRTFATLTSGLTAGVTTHMDIAVSAGGFPPFGSVLVGAELISYTGLAGPPNQLTGLTRGAGVNNYSTSDVTHATGTLVYLVELSTIISIDYESSRGIYHIGTFSRLLHNQPPQTKKDMFQLSEDYVVVVKYAGTPS